MYVCIWVGREKLELEDAGNDRAEIAQFVWLMVDALKNII